MTFYLSHCMQSLGSTHRRCNFAHHITSHITSPITHHTSHITPHTPHFSPHTPHPTGSIPIVEHDREFWDAAVGNILNCTGQPGGGGVFPMAFVKDDWMNVDVVVRMGDWDRLVVVTRHTSHVTPPSAPLAHPSRPIQNPLCDTPLPLPSPYHSAPKPKP